MKKLVFTLLLLTPLFLTPTFGQGLSKGNLLGIHTMKINLDPDVTMNQYKDFLLSTLVNRTQVGHTIPAYVVRADHIDQADKQIFAVFGPFVREIGAEWVQDEEVFVGGVVQRLT